MSISRWDLQFLFETRFRSSENFTKCLKSPFPPSVKLAEVNAPNAKRHNDEKWRCQRVLWQSFWNAFHNEVRVVITNSLISLTFTISTSILGAFIETLLLHQFDPEGLTAAAFSGTFVATYHLDTVRSTLTRLCNEYEITNISEHAPYLWHESQFHFVFSKQRWRCHELCLSNMTYQLYVIDVPCMSGAWVLKLYRKR